MRHKGKVTDWRDDQGYGFITPSAGGEKVFLHISALASRDRRPAENDLVTYDLTFDRKKRARASNVRFTRSAGKTRSAGASPIPPRRAGTDAIALAVAPLFLAGIGIAAVAGRLPMFVLAVYVGASFVAFLAYAFDKSAARSNRWRTQESTLHLISLVGGWPGALLAQRLLHHKSRKAAFQRVYWATVVLNCAALYWLLTPQGSELLSRAASL